MNSLIKWIVTDDRQQALRIRRFLMAFSGYLLLLVMLVVIYFFGFKRDIGLAGLAAMAAGLIAANVVIYLMFISGINQRFRDPSLTIPQLLVGIFFMTALCYYSPDVTRGITLMVYILIFMFGIFRLGLREFFSLVAVAVVLYVLAMILLHRHDPGQVSIRLEVLRCFILLVSLLWVSLLGTYIANLRRTVSRLASHDGLTTIYNRREGFKCLAREKAFADRTGIPFSICMIDIDDFKAVNDTYGHLAGDSVLKAFALALKDNIRNEDYVARYGGEEFLVIFVNFECRDGNAECIQRLLKIARGLTFPEISESLRISASIGVAAYQSTDTIDSLVDRADRALYRAKAGGKNRIEYSLDETP